MDRCDNSTCCLDQTLEKAEMKSQTNGTKAQKQAYRGITAIIPARAGSLSIPNKNSKLFNGKPLIWWSIRVAKHTREISRIILTSDCKKCQEIGYNMGIEVLKRPEDISGPESLDIEYLKHAVDKAAIVDEDIIVLLRPTTPLRIPSIISGAIEKLRTFRDATSVCSVHSVGALPFKSMVMKDGWLAPIHGNTVMEQYNYPRQSFNEAYYPNGYVDILKPEIIKGGQVYGDRPMALYMPKAIDIDDVRDWERAEKIAKKKDYEWIFSDGESD